MAGTSWPWKRTDELKALDVALEKFEKRRSHQNLGHLMGALDRWARFKGLLPDGKIKTNRKPQVVSRLVNDVIDANRGLFGVWFDQDMEIARDLCDPYLDKRVIGQGLGDSEDDKEKYKQGAGQSAGALFDEIKKLRTKENENIVPSKAKQANVFGSADFWLRKGQAQQNAPDNSGIWCDASAALIVHLLARNPNFKSSLHLVSQGDPKHFGHWYVVANRGDNELLDFEHYFGDANGETNFTIDIWGAIHAGRDSSIVFPAQAIYDCRHNTREAYDNNDIVVRCKFPAKRV